MFKILIYKIIIYLLKLKIVQFLFDKKIIKKKEKRLKNIIINTKNSFWNNKYLTF